MNISDLLKNPDKAKEVLRDAIDDLNKELAEMLIPIVKDPYLTYKYAQRIVRKPIKDEWEDIIAQSAPVSCWYAENVLHGPFLKGEPTIAKDSLYSFDYAKNILKDRFLLGENIIIKDKEYLKDYISFLESIYKLDEFLKDHPEVKDKL